MRRRSLTEHDQAVWAAYVRNVQTLPGVSASPPAPLLPTSTVARAAPTRVRAVPSTLELGQHPAGIDSATWNRFRNGKLRPSRTLDLHGRTAQRAHEALHVFLAGAHAEGLRCVEVITGQGLRSGAAGEGGVIRRELPLWLNGPALRPLVLAAAHPHPANLGSVRVLLRKVRRS